MVGDARPTDRNAWLRAALVAGHWALPVAACGFDSRAKGILYWEFGGTIQRFCVVLTAPEVRRLQSVSSQGTS
jgi:hypothetical protein